MLDALAREAVTAHGKYKELFASDPPLLSLVSTLAEGADHIAAEAALSRGFVLDAPLPFAVETYSTDFKSEHACLAPRRLRLQCCTLKPFAVRQLMAWRVRSGSFTTFRARLGTSALPPVGSCPVGPSHKLS